MVRLTESLERLVQFYEATGRLDEAIKWQNELEDTKQRLTPTPNEATVPD